MRPHECPHATYIQSLSVVAPCTHCHRDAIYLARTTLEVAPRLLTKAEANSEPDAHTDPGGPPGAASSSTVPAFNVKPEQQEQAAVATEDEADGDEAM